MKELLIKICSDDVKLDLDDHSNVPVFIKQVEELRHIGFARLLDDGHWIIRTIDAINFAWLVENSLSGLNIIRRQMWDYGERASVYCAIEIAENKKARQSHLPGDLSNKYYL